MSVAVEYYEKKFGENAQAAFIHLVREIGEIAFAMEKSNAEHAKLEITESVALLHYLASRYGLDVNANMQAVYAKKLDQQKAK
jgi:NTP pyrophosphatase (non-canonical NTP hydrolase)